VPVWETSPAGPFNQWPTGGGGFEYFYGFIGGEANQWYPTLYEGTTPVEPKKTPAEGYHLVEDMTDKAIGWISQQRALAPDKPFFVYFAPGATHAPHHVPKEWADKYKGKFDAGWDKLREEIFARQKKLGVIPADCQLTPRPKEVPAWGDMPEAFKPVLRREMEVYAGYLEYTDHHVGRLFDGLDKLGITDDTLVYYIIGDNGASAEGSLNGCFNEMSYFNGLQSLETPEYLSARLDKLGGPESYNHYAVGWAHALNTPYQWTKQVASHFGGTRNGTIVHWPKGIKAKGEIRSQFAHVIDVAPTILEAAGIPEPLSVDGIEQDPIEGVSMLYSFNDAKAAERHETQYFEVMGNRAIYHKGWSAVTKHYTPWITAPRPALDDDIWELYDTTKDWSQSKDLSKEMAQKLRELQRLWLIEAVRYKVLPLDDRMLEKLNPDTAGRPVLIKGKTQLLFGGMGHLSENCVLNLKNKSHSVTAEIVVPEGGAEGVIIAQGANIGGWSLYAKGGKLKYCYNWGGYKHFFVEGTVPIPAGEHQVRMEFAYAGGGLGKGGKVTLFTDGKKVGEGDIPATLATIFSADDGCDVGEDTGASVSPDYGPHGNGFNGRVKGVQLAIADAAEDLDHLINPEDAIRMAIARQ
jgi:arylsulfatase